MFSNRIPKIEPYYSCFFPHLSRYHHDTTCNFYLWMQYAACPDGDHLATTWYPLHSVHFLSFGCAILVNICRKCYMGDTGLLISMAFDEITQTDLSGNGDWI